MFLYSLPPFSLSLAHSSLLSPPATQASLPRKPFLFHISHLTSLSNLRPTSPPHSTRRSRSVSLPFFIFQGICFLCLAGRKATRSTLWQTHSGKHSLSELLSEAVQVGCLGHSRNPLQFCKLTTYQSIVSDVVSTADTGKQDLSELSVVSVT